MNNLMKLTCAVALTLGFGVASVHAQSTNDIVNSLKPANPPPVSSGGGLTRSIGIGGGAAQQAPDPRTQAQRNLINTMRTRSIAVEAVGPAPTVEERAQVAEIAKSSPAIDLEILFDYNSSTLTPNAWPLLAKLGVALNDPALKGSVFLINGYTDAAGSPDYNLGLSQRRADSVRKALIDQFQVPATALIPVGFGKENLKNPGNPLGNENRRVQIVNTNVNATAGR